MENLEATRVKEPNLDPSVTGHFFLTLPFGGLNRLKENITSRGPEMRRTWMKGTNMPSELPRKQIGILFCFLKMPITARVGQASLKQRREDEDVSRKMICAVWHSQHCPLVAFSHLANPRRGPQSSPGHRTAGHSGIRNMLSVWGAG